MARDDEDEPVPLFGTWRAAYTAVIVSAITVMALILAFSKWPF